LDAAAADVLIEKLPQHGLLWQGALRYTITQAAISQSSSSSSRNGDGMGTTSWRHLKHVLAVEAKRVLSEVPQPGIGCEKLQMQLELLLKAADELLGEQTAAAKVQAMMAMLLPEHYNSIWSRKQQPQQLGQGRDAVDNEDCSTSLSKAVLKLSLHEARASAPHGQDEDVSSSSSSCYEDGRSTCSNSNTGDLVDHKSIRDQSLHLFAALPLHMRLVLAGLVLGTHLSLDAAALVWRFLVEAEQSGGPAWEEDVPLQVVLLMQEAQGLQQTVVQQMHNLAVAEQRRSSQLRHLQQMKQQLEQEQQQEHKQGSKQVEQQQQQEQQLWPHEQDLCLEKGESLDEEQQQLGRGESSSQQQQLSKQGHKQFADEHGEQEQEQHQQKQRQAGASKQQQADAKAAESFHASMGEIQTRVSPIVISTKPQSPCP
jgi:hypothetical protein